jgi:hypothetical protein
VAKLGHAETLHARLLTFNTLIRRTARDVVGEGRGEGELKDIRDCSLIPVVLYVLSLSALIKSATCNTPAISKQCAFELIVHGSNLNG